METNNRKVYVVNATEASHAQAAVKFANKHNIPLVIKNTGHSYIGRYVDHLTELKFWT
jgi:CRISPR/Cas system-associated endonuclease Cas1